jgi:hypothetical protein
MSVKKTWERLLNESENCSAQLNSKLSESWQSLHKLFVRQMEAFEVVSQLGFDFTSFAGAVTIAGPQAQSLLIEPIESYRRERPQQRTLEALENWDRVMEGMISAMPESLSMTAEEWLALAGTTGMNLRLRLRMKWLPEPVDVAFRENLLYGFQLLRASRVRPEGRLMRLLAECSLDLTLPWQSLVQLWLPQLLSRHADLGAFRKDTQKFRQRLSVYEKRAAQILDEFREWSANSAQKIASRAPLRRKMSRSDERIERLGRRYFSDRAFWMRQSRAVDSSIDVAIGLRTAERAMVERTRTTLAEIGKEHQALRDELGRVVTWLENWNQDNSSSFPSVDAGITPVANRVSTWAHDVDNVSLDLPETIEVAVRARTRLPRLTFRMETPRFAFRGSLQRQAETVIRDGLDHLQRQRMSIVQQIERAREVVAFAAETAQKGGREERQIEREGIQNARSLLEFYRAQTQHIPPEVERSFVRALSQGFLRIHMTLHAGQLGAAGYIARYGVPATAGKLLTGAIDAFREGARWSTQRGGAMYRETLIRIGWVPAPTARVPRVNVRVYLSRTLGAESNLERLPAIYQRLFRLAPVEDPRFLIGRQEEMTALMDARHLWERGREAAVIIVGERGSGKTSLLNCAVQSGLAGLEIIRSEFSERLTRTEEMYLYLGNLLGVSPQDVDQKLSSGKRVVILEELERTFLRLPNHFGAFRALINLVSKTSRHTLWLLSINYFAFRLLNAAVHLDPHFSHRINAMAVDRNHLREAILLRHNLSGLRLAFTPAPEQRAYVKRLRVIAGLEADPEPEFFDILYRESGGVFRTAFALWQRYIDRAEGGILYMRRPTMAPYEEIIESLSDVDLFTLAAIFQHGSLTPAEHSQIFRVDRTTSNTWLDDLLARELIEPDHGRSGFRVVPEAGELVRQTLFRRNVA